MTKQEAIQAMKEGKKVTHRFFSRGEWVEMTGSKSASGDDLISTEEGYSIPQFTFFSDRNLPQWENGWSIYNQHKQ